MLIVIVIALFVQFYEIDSLLTWLSIFKSCQIQCSQLQWVEEKIIATEFRGLLLNLKKKFCINIILI